MQKSEKIQKLIELIDTVHKLRAPGGCAWDRKQTHQSLRQYLVEEAYEVMDVLDQIHTTDDLKNEKIRSEFREELGDLLMQVVLHSEMTAEQGVFDIYDVAEALNDKLIRRHPHVFGDAKADSEEAAFQTWEKQKAREKAANPETSVLDGVPKGLPALQRVARVLEKVTKVGFQWNDMHGPLAKVDEELAELKAEVLALEKDQDNAKLRARVESELGDLFFTLCNVSYLMKVNPEDALRGMIARFEDRFRYVERKLKESGKLPEHSTLEEMDRYWDEAKAKAKERTKEEEKQGGAPLLKTPPPWAWGLTGGIASGKSTIARLFAKHGIPVVDADQVARDLSAPGGAAHDRIVQRFGTADRAKLREIIFRNMQARVDLEAILHPLIAEESVRRLSALGPGPAIYEASLLVETGRHRDLAGLIVVEAPWEERIRRVMARDHSTREQAERILYAQLSDKERRAVATFVVDNSGTVETLEAKIDALASKLRSLAGASENPKR